MRVFRRIPRNDAWLYDNIGVGRGATRYFFFLHNGSYWWPRRKGERERKCTTRLAVIEKLDAEKGGRAAGVRMYKTQKDPSTEDRVISEQESGNDGALEEPTSAEPSQMQNGRGTEGHDARDSNLQNAQAPVESGRSKLEPSRTTPQPASTNTGDEQSLHAKDANQVHQYPDGTTAEGEIESFHPDLYQFLVPWSPWSKATDPEAGSVMKKDPPVEDTTQLPDWQEFENGSAYDDWHAAYEKQEAETGEDLEMAWALRDQHGPEKVYENWEKYVTALVDPGSQSEPLNRTIHVLGLDTVGKYIAHSIAALPQPPPVTLLMHRPLMMQYWHDEEAAIHVIKGNKLETQTNFHIESSAEFKRQDDRQRFVGFGPNTEHTSEPPRYPIDTLIVATPTERTVKALLTIKDRLRESSTILFINDGLGLAELVNEKVFTDPYRRPTYILGNITHNLEATERHFTIIEKEPGQLQCSKLPQDYVSRSHGGTGTLRRTDMSWSAGAKHLVGTLARTPCLSTKTLGHKSFFASQLQQLVANAVIGPLSVVYDTTNDHLLYNFAASQAMRALLNEMSYLIRSFPELQSLPQIHDDFAPEKLYAVIVSKIRKSGKNLTKMLQDVRAGNRTEIMFHNGYLHRRAYELGIDAPRNEMLLHLVTGKRAARIRELNNYIPFEHDC